MHHSDSTVRFKKHSMEHPVPILTHAAHRRHKKIRAHASLRYGVIIATNRRRLLIRPTALNMTLAIILGLGIIFGAAVLFWTGYRALMTGFVNFLTLFPTVY